MEVAQVGAHVNCQKLFLGTKGNWNAGSLLVNNTNRGSASKELHIVSLAIKIDLLPAIIREE